MRRIYLQGRIADQVMVEGKPLDMPVVEHVASTAIKGATGAAASWQEDQLIVFVSMEGDRAPLFGRKWYVNGYIYHSQCVCVCVCLSILSPPSYLPLTFLLLLSGVH